MSTNIDPVQTFKILIIGDSNVGKTALMNRMVHGVFSYHHAATIGIDFKVATINIGEYKCRLQIWDTAGQERYRSLTSTYYRGADGVLIIYDVRSNESFDSVKSRFPELDFYCDENVPRILVGNKDDEDSEEKKVVRTRYARELAEQNNLSFFETSVRDNKNVTEVFQRIAKLALQRRLAQSEDLETSISIMQIPPITNNTRRQCCFA